MALSVCGTTANNTGAIACGEAPGKIAYMAIWGGELTTNEMATVTTIKAALLADSKLSKSASAKLFLLPTRQNLEKKKGNNVTQTFSNGIEIVAREGFAGYRVNFFTTLAQMKSLYAFHNKEVRVIVQDDGTKIFGTLDPTGQFIGRKCRVTVEMLDHPGDDEVAGVGYMEFIFTDVYESKQGLYYVQPGVSLPATTVALVDVQAYEFGAAASNVLKVSAKADIGEAGKYVDIYGDYSTTLFNTGGLWTATNVANNASVTITGIASNAGGYGAMTIDSTAYSALSSGAQLRIAAVVPNLLDAGGAVGIEVASFIHTKP